MCSDGLWNYVLDVGDFVWFMVDFVSKVYIDDYGYVFLVGVVDGFIVYVNNCGGYDNIMVVLWCWDF